MSKPAAQRKVEREERARALRRYRRKRKETVQERNERILRGPESFVVGDGKFLLGGTLYVYSGPMPDVCPK